MATPRPWMSPAVYLFPAYTWVLKKTRGVQPWQGPLGCQNSHTFLGGPLLLLPSTLFKAPYSLSPPAHRQAWPTATLSFSLPIKMEEEFPPVEDDLLTCSPVFSVELGTASQQFPYHLMYLSLSIGVFPLTLQHLGSHLTS